MLGGVYGRSGGGRIGESSAEHADCYIFHQVSSGTGAVEVGR